MHMPGMLTDADPRCVERSFAAGADEVLSYGWAYGGGSRGSDVGIVRDGGIFNIYSINLETGETNLHTNVVAGVFSPTVFIGKDNTEKLVFARRPSICAAMSPSRSSGVLTLLSSSAMMSSTSSDSS